MMELLGVEMEIDDEGYMAPKDMPDWQKELAKQFMRSAGHQWVIVNMPRQNGFHVD